jgi:hypothetical protein
MNKLLFIVLLLVSFSGLSQQRIGLELFSHLDDLSIGTHFQKVVKSKFILGGGLIWVTNRRGEAIEYEPGQVLHTGIRSVPVSFVRNNETYVVQTSRTASKALMLTLNTGFFHEFGALHGIRVNLNGRIGFARTKGTYSYYGQINDTVIPVRYSKNHLVAGVVPEIYHTLRQRKKLTFYYGLRFPFYFSLDKRNFNPIHRKEGFYGLEMEAVIGITYFVGKNKQ